MDAVSLPDGPKPNLLLELTWHEKSPLTKVLMANRGRWIHFTNVKKLGINPRKKHWDPHGIYFYPVDWLLEPHERINIGQQYGLNQPYYFIADVDLSPPGINLGTITWDEVWALAKRNGWYDYAQEYLSHPKEKHSTILPYYAKTDHPGSFLWHFIDYLTKKSPPLISWNRALAGVAWVLDPNEGIIHNLEPYQLLVRDPRRIHNVTFGENTPITKNNAETRFHYEYALKALFKTLHARYGGTLTYKKKSPILTFRKGIVNFELREDDPKEFETPSLTLDYHWKRAKGQKYLNRETFRNSSMDQLIETLSNWIDEIGARTNDLLFKPVMSIEDGMEFMRYEIGDGSPMEFKVEIDNDRDEWSHVHIIGRITKDHGPLYTSSVVHLNIYETHISLSVGARVGKYAGFGEYVLYGNADGEVKNYSTGEVVYKTKEELIDEVLTHMVEKLPLYTNQYSPVYRTSYRRYVGFPHNDIFEAFKGWFIANCGLSLGGKLEKAFASEIEAYLSYPDKKNLLPDIAYATRKW